MTSLASILDSLPAAPDARTLLESFVPPPRFAGKRFDQYAPDPSFPSQGIALERLRAVAAELGAGGGWLARARSALGRGRGGGIYLDGGFGVGKTHLLASLWNAAPGPKAYLSFDELVYVVGMLGVERARAAFRDQRLVAVDEWELDDPGNLKLALAFLRGAVEDGVRLAVTSNTVPAELGAGRFSQKDFTLEIEELGSAFEVVPIRGEDYRHRRFEADPGREYFLESAELERRAREAGERAVPVGFAELLRGLAGLHPIRYVDVVERVDALFVRGLAPIEQLPDALRWVHFIDKVYDGSVALAASGETTLGALFPGAFLEGPYAKKLSRCLSRMEELLAESSTAGASAPPAG